MNYKARDKIISRLTGKHYVISKKVSKSGYMLTDGDFITEEYCIKYTNFNISEVLRRL